MYKNFLKYGNVIGDTTKSNYNIMYPR